MYTVAQLEKLVKAIPDKLIAWPEVKMLTPRAIGKWSNLQILGHLCDSAINNLTRIIQAQSASEPFVINPYNQDKWVEAQRYTDASVEEIVTLWESLNGAMLRVITAMPEDLIKSKEIRLTSGEQHTLEWLFNDYLEHMKHHLHQISPELLED
ncbi:DinB family protein [Paenibacillus sp. YAF4_2]|uniref:DinB family protein n=1 Tax=Paenibacillus sp. YAF4_2 TaxID=3233085 RepID=UPI003F9609F7